MTTGETCVSRYGMTRISDQPTSDRQTADSYRRNKSLFSVKYQTSPDGELFRICNSNAKSVRRFGARDVTFDAVYTISLGFLHLQRPASAGISVAFLSNELISV